MNPAVCHFGIGGGVFVSAVQRHGTQEIECSQMEFLIQKQILRISDRGEHTAKIGGSRFEYDRQNAAFFVTDAGIDHKRERHEGQKRHIIRYQHGRKTGEHHKDQSEPSDIPGAFEQHPGGMLKQSCPPQPRDRCHQAKQFNEHRAVAVPQICRIRRDQECGDGCCKKRDDQHGLCAEKGSQTLHEIAHMNSAESVRQMSSGTVLTAPKARSSFGAAPSAQQDASGMPSFPSN